MAYISNSKYETTGETKVVDGVTLYRIRAVKDFGCVKKGDLGGWIEKESNLSEDGNAWVGDDAIVSGDALVWEDALVSGDAHVFDNALVSGDAHVFDNARVFDNALVSGDALVWEDAWVRGNARVTGNAVVYGEARVGDDAIVSGNTVIFGHVNARIGNTQVAEKDKDKDTSKDQLSVLKEVLNRIIRADSHIDSSPRGERKVIYGEFATMALNALKEIE